MTNIDTTGQFDDASKLTGLDAKIAEVEVQLQIHGWYGAAIEFRKMVDEDHPDMDEESKKMLLLDYLRVYLDVKSEFNSSSELRLAAMVQKQISEARTDSLTGLDNVRAFNEKLQTEIDRLSALSGENRSPKTDTAFMIMVDLDGFKPINDTLGHHAGDVALQTVARTLKETVRQTDTCARTGGDEFVVLIPANSDEDGQSVLQALTSAFENLTFEHKGANYRIGASFGLSQIDPSQTLVANKELADAEMYRVKEAKGDTRHAVIEKTGSAVKGDAPSDPSV